MVGDGCGGFVSCGSCGSGQVCSSNHCCPSDRPVWNGKECVECTSSNASLCVGGEVCSGGSCVCHSGTTWNGSECVKQNSNSLQVPFIFVRSDKDSDLSFKIPKNGSCVVLVYEDVDENQLFFVDLGAPYTFSKGNNLAVSYCSRSQNRPSSFHGLDLGNSDSSSNPKFEGLCLSDKDNTLLIPPSQE